MHHVRTARRLALTFFLAAAVAGGSAFADELLYPDTAPAGHARAWFAANAAGAEAIRAFWTAHGDAASLQRRPVEVRVGVWRNMHHEAGTITPLKVLESRADFIAVQARDGTGELVTVRFECAPAEPHGLLGIGVKAADGPGDDGPGPGAAVPPPSGPPPSDAEIVSALSTELDSLSHAGAFSGTALLMKGDATLLARASGMASRERRVANTLDTRFNLGSINKIFTQVAILQLAEAGKLQLDSAIVHYVPDYPADKASRITVRQLLEHRGGVPDVFGPHFDSTDPHSLKQVADWLALVRDEPLEFEPGTRQRYSNGGYVLLGAIVEHLSGEDYYDYVKRHIYDPAGMTRTGHLFESAATPERATAYTRGEELPDASKGETASASAMRPAPLPERGSPAGGGYSTAPDLAKFVRALRSGKLVDASLGGRMVGPAASLGIAGGSPGVNGLLEMEGTYTLVVLANLDPPAAERFMRTVGRMVMRAASPGPGGPERHVLGGGSH